MKSKMTMLNRQRQLMGACGSQMPNEVRAYNDMKIKMLEAAAFEELKRDFIQSAQDEMTKANSESAKQFVNEVNKAFDSLGFK